MIYHIQNVSHNSQVNVKSSICIFQRETAESKAERLHHETDEEQKEKAEGRRQKEESVIKRKRRKGKVKHKELIFGGMPLLLCSLCQSEDDVIPSGILHNLGSNLFYRKPDKRGGGGD